MRVGGVDGAAAAAAALSGGRTQRLIGVEELVLLGNTAIGNAGASAIAAALTRAATGPGVAEGGAGSLLRLLDLTGASMTLPALEPLAL